MKRLRVRTQLVRGWLSGGQLSAPSALACIEVAVVLTMVGIDRGLKAASTTAQLSFAFYVLVLLFFVSLVGFVLLGLERYFCVTERAGKLGVLRVLGASSRYVFGLLLMETATACVPGAAAGICMTFLIRIGAASAFPKLLRVDVVYLWWPIAFGIAATGSVVGGVIGARRAVRDGVVQALSYKP
jgi:ABC-type antimicrobial peptide transport system permease subunit